MDEETKRQLLKAAIGVVASSLAAVLSAVALRYIVLDKLLEGESPAISGVGAQPVAAGQLGDLNLSKYESALLADLVLPQDVDASLDDIGGLWEQIAELKERVLYPLQHPRMFAHSSVLRRPTGVLLYGPPGTGKTLLAKAIAKSTKAAFLNVNVAQLQSKWFGESPKLIAALFSLARKLSPCIIFADELDGFLSARESGGGGGQYEVTNKTQFLQCWEGLTSAGSSGDEHWVLVIGATNRPWALDPAVLRRMPRQIRVDLPDSTARADILRVLLRTEHCEPDLQLELPLIAEQAEGLSGSDLREVVREAAMVPVREALERQRQASPAPDAVLRWSGGATGTSAGRDDTDAQDSDEAQSSIDEHLEQHQDELRPISAGDLLVGLSRVRPSTDAADEYRRAASSLPGHRPMPRFGDAASGAAAAGSGIHQHGASAAPAAGRGQQHTDGCPMCASSLLHLAQHFGGGHLGGGFG